MTAPEDQQERASGWQLEGNSAEAYERYLVPEMFEPWADKLLEKASLKPGDHVLDVGCGTGIVARRAATLLDSDSKVVGLDPNEGMLEVARSVSADVQPAIEWRDGDAAELPFPEGAFDVVFCQQVLQFLSDPKRALEEIHRVLVEDGRLALSVWRPIEFHSSYVTMADGLGRHVGDEAAGMMRSPFPSWDLSEVRNLVTDAGFREAAVTIGIGSMRYPSPEEFVRREAASSPLAGPLGSLERDVRDALVRDVAEELREYADDEGIVFPMETYIAVGRK